jgi:arylsulfatase A-like enzyme
MDSASSWTCPSVVSLLTGQYPHRHGAGLIPGEPKHLRRDNLPTILDARVPILPDALGTPASAAFLGVWNAGLSLPGRFPYVEADTGSDAALIKRASSWMSEQTDSFFCWVHLKGPHDPLDVSRADRDVFGPISSFRSAKHWRFQREGDDVSGEAFAAYFGDRTRLYDAAARVADSTIRDLWESLGDDVQGRTTLAVTADHGEELWEHRDEEIEYFEDPRNVFGVGHGHNLFQEHILVPLIITGPGIPAGAIDQNVSLVDVVPTLIAAAEDSAPKPADDAFDGRSLLDPLPRGRPVLAEAIAYGHEKVAVVMDDHKLLSSALDGYERLFDLDSNRKEATAADDAEMATTLRAALPSESGEGGEQAEVTTEITKHLSELGYVEE